MSLKSNPQQQLNRGFLVALSSAIVLSFTAILIRADLAELPTAGPNPGLLAGDLRRA